MQSGLERARELQRNDGVLLHTLTTLSTLDGSWGFEAQEGLEVMGRLWGFPRTRLALPPWTDSDYSVERAKGGFPFLPFPPCFQGHSLPVQL